MARLNPYLAFNGTCRAAMTFYKECLGGEIVDMMTFETMPGAEGMPAEMRDRILHSMLVADAMVLMGADTPDGQDPSKDGPITVCLSSEDKDEIKAYYAKLAVGATITQPLSDEFFGLYGALTDQYGINWMFQAGAAPDA